MGLAAGGADVHPTPAPALGRVTRVAASRAERRSCPGASRRRRRSTGPERRARPRGGEAGPGDGPAAHGLAPGARAQERREVNNACGLEVKVAGQSNIRKATRLEEHS
ncbi:unnamed protein product [Caretta caretta]